MRPPTLTPLHGLLVSLLLPGNPLSAQACRGAAPFSNGPVAIGLALGNVAGTKHVEVDRGSALGVEVDAGSHRGLFAGAGISRILLSDPGRFVQGGLAARQTDDASATAIAGVVGYGVALSAAPYVELCPFVGVVRQNGPTLWRDCTDGCSGELDGTLTAFSVGGSAGAAPGFVTADVRFVPFFGAAFVSSGLTAHGEGSSETVRENYVAVAGGLGLVLRRLTIRPVVSYPIGLDGAGARYGLDVLVSVGRRLL